MKPLTKYPLLIALIFYSMAVYSQNGPEKAGRLEDGRFILKIALSWNNQQKEKLAGLFDLDSLIMDKIFTRNFAYLNDSTEWIVQSIRPGLVEISKPLGLPSDTWVSDIILSEITKASKIPPPTPPPAPANYGVNDLTQPEAFSYTDGTACFFLPGYQNAKNVHLSGSFNQWSTMRMPMKKTADGWTYCIDLPPGKHLYKFIVDGRWMPDPNNKKRESDGHRSYNSLIFCYNQVFELNGYENARRVILAGSFNDWNSRELRMEKTPEGWKLPIFLREGTHAYKFIVDGNWILDPANPVTRPDGSGNINSFIGIGDTAIFRLRGFENAENVILTGSFNAWNRGELFMEKIDDTWQIPYVLGAGNYEYKFIVDGRWITDPLNPFITGSGDLTNSFFAFKPNHLFVLSDFSDAERVVVSGSFNGWSHNDYRMVYRDGEWVFPVYLTPGRHSYKFIVDGEWILDPDNPLWEDNEFGTGNSVLWVE
jgi:hypothetical protein